MGRKLTNEEAIQKCIATHGDKYDYSKLNYVNAATKVIIICPVHGDFEQLLYSHYSGSGCAKCASEVHGQSKIINHKQVFLEKCRQVHGNRYGLELITYTNAHSIINVKCFEHGIFKIKANSFLNGGNCPHCSKTIVSVEDKINQGINVHNDFYDYSKVNYVNAKTKVIINCPKHGDFEQILNNHIKGHGCPKCSISGYQISKQEQDYADYLIELLGDKNVEQSNRTILNGKELDIYLPEHKMAIEYNGLYWHSSSDKEDDAKKRKQHLEKTELCAKQGIELLHINEGDNVDLWKQVIKNKLGLNKRIYARKTSIRTISNKESNNFLEHNHLQGKCASSINYGLYYENKLLSVMTFSKARYSDADWELIRFCTKGGYTVVGGASKLLKMFRTHHEGVIISYANKRWSNGNLYEKLGFTFLHDSAPCYWYIKDNKLWHRSKFMKHKLKKELPDFDPKLSEVENMYLNGYRRIWDCGNKVYKM